ncbi:MAG: type I DNA topoisomerase [Candidatus Aminicenantes bacterium]|nr:type I DNA topoisomerase [Candidatus Aminicenantes bacterium]
MQKRLVIVESPAKAKTVNRYLGSEFVVKASVGHIRDLPKSKLGVDPGNDFAPDYVIIPGKKEIVKEIQQAAKNSSEVFLAADPDREGEAICWHLRHLLKEYNEKIYRILFHEITKKSITEAFSERGFLDENKFNAQQTRRILDRLVGYLISPLLWKKIGRGLSAGRVQSIALRFICEREKEIKNFVPEEYWTITALLEASQPPVFKASLIKIDGKKAKIDREEKAAGIVGELKKSSFVLSDVRIKQKKRSPAPPYITSTLQQESYRLLRFSVKKTMITAQKLYEGLEIGNRGFVGLITYMRTDSVRLADDAVQSARQYIEKNFSADYLPSAPRVFKNKKKAQDAHEAIRPTSLDLSPDVVKPYLKREEYALYRLIWNRFVASQMKSAIIEETVLDIKASRYLLQAKGEVVIFDGFLALYPSQNKENEKLPKVEKGEKFKLLELESKQNFTQPPPRYTEGSLVKELEAKGIGRPSTYAPIISTLQDRVYVIKEKGKFIPTELGLFVTDYLIANFPDLMEFEFTAHLEEDLDRISEGDLSSVDSLRKYYSLLDSDLKQAMEKEGVKGKGIPLDDVCPKCGRQLVIKSGRYGRFKACSGYPECDFKQSMGKKEAKPLEEKCPQCGSNLVVRHGRYGAFTACSNYPQCKYIKKESSDTGIPCPMECGGTILRKKTRRGKTFYGCSKYPDCDFATWDEPLSKSCPECGAKWLLKKTPAKKAAYIYCYNKDCDYKEELEQEESGENQRENNKDVRET